MNKGYRNINEYLELICELNKIEHINQIKKGLEHSKYVHRIDKRQWNEPLFVDITMSIDEAIAWDEDKSQSIMFGHLDYIKRINIVDNIWRTKKGGDRLILIGENGIRPPHKRKANKCIGDLYFNIPRNLKQYEYETDWTIDTNPSKSQPGMNIKDPYIERRNAKPIWLEYRLEYGRSGAGMCQYGQIERIGTTEVFKRECLEYAKYSKYEMLRMIREAKGIHTPRPLLRAK